MKLTATKLYYIFGLPSFFCRAPRVEGTFGMITAQGAIFNDAAYEAARVTINRLLPPGIAVIIICDIFFKYSLKYQLNFRVIQEKRYICMKL